MVAFFVNYLDLEICIDLGNDFNYYS